MPLLLWGNTASHPASRTLFRWN